MELSATIPALLSQQVATYGSETILRKKDQGIWNAVTWSELDDHVRLIGQGLRAAGLAHGEVVAVISETRPEFVYVDLAILSCGATSIAIGVDEDAARVSEILRETATSVVFVEGEEHLDKILGIRSACSDLRLIVIIDTKGLRDFQDPACISVTELVAGGAKQSDWKAAVASVTADQCAAIVVPRSGACQPVTYTDLMHQIDAVGASLGVRPGDERIAVLPMCDPTERVLGLYLALKHRIISNYLENPETATENLREVKPTVFGANTEAWERLHARITALAEGATAMQKFAYRWAIKVGAGGGVMAMLANLLVLSAVRAQLGFGRLRIAYVGDQANSDVVIQWARALGITVRYINPFQRGETHA